MMRSFRRQIVLWITKLKGLKKAFSGNPIHYKKLRKDDRKVPLSLTLAGNETSVRTIGQCKITEIIPKGLHSEEDEHLLIYFHGGAFVSGPTDLYWLGLSRMVKNTKTRAWLVDYPKAPEHQAEAINAEVDEVFTEAISLYQPSKIVLIGDSAGGNLAFTLIQRLLKKKAELPVLVVGISPLVDLSLTHPEIAEIDTKDPILSYNGVLSSNQMFAGELELTDSSVSPLYGELEGFPPVMLFVAERDILAPDARILAQRLQDAGVDVEVFEGKDLFHIWPMFAILQESSEALEQIEARILQVKQKS